MINFPKGITSSFMMSRTEWNNACWNLENCDPVLPLNFVYNNNNKFDVNVEASLCSLPLATVHKKETLD